MLASGTPMLSVIVPVYNVGKYLYACVESILAQTFQDFELILVDDGSTDECPAICDACKESDSRVVVIHKENGGLSSARNAGMAVARAKLLSFIDSDDFIHPQMLEALLNPLLSDDHTSISMCAYSSFTLEDKCRVGRMHLPSPKTFDSVRALEMVYGNEIPNITFVAWNKIYRRSLFEQAAVSYPEGKLYEDGFTTYRLLYEADRVAIVNAELYFYRKRPGSITASKNTVDGHLLDAVEADYGAWKFFSGKERCLAVASTKALLRTCMRIWLDSGEDVYGRAVRQQVMSVYKRVWSKDSKLLKREPSKRLAYGLFPLIPRLIGPMVLS